MFCVKMLTCSKLCPGIQHETCWFEAGQYITASTKGTGHGLIEAHHLRHVCVCSRNIKVTQGIDFVLLVFDKGETQTQQ